MPSPAPRSQTTPTKTPRSETAETPMRDGRNRGETGSSPVNIIPPSSPGTALAMSEIDLSSPLNYGTPSSLGSVRTPRSGIRGTPIRLRPDVRTDKRIRQVNLGSDPVSGKYLQIYICIYKIRLNRKSIFA